MSYVNSNLQADERVLDRTTVHWIVYMPGLVTLLFAPILFAYCYRIDPDPAGNWRYFVGPELFLAMIGAYLLIRAAITQFTTEVAITDRRIIYKTGLLSRRTLEMNIDKVESVDINQSIVGQFLDYGTIVVRGVGTGMEPLDSIEAPIKFRDSVLSQTVGPAASPAGPPPPLPSGFTGPEPALPEGPVFGHRRPMGQ